MLLKVRMSHGVTSYCEILLPWQQKHTVVALLSEGKTSNLAELPTEATAINDVTCNLCQRQQRYTFIGLLLMADNLIFGTYVPWGNNSIW